MLLYLTPRGDTWISLWYAASMWPEEALRHRVFFRFVLFFLIFQLLSAKSTLDSHPNVNLASDHLLSLAHRLYVKNWTNSRWCQRKIWCFFMVFFFSNHGGGADFTYPWLIPDGRNEQAQWSLWRCQRYLKWTQLAIWHHRLLRSCHSKGKHTPNCA